MILFAAASLMLVACDGTKKPATDGETPETEAAAPQTEETTTEGTEAASGDTFAKYEELVNKAIPLLEKIQKGDVSAANDYQKLNEEITALMPELQKEMSNMTPEKAQKYQELAERLAKAAQPK